MWRVHPSDPVSFHVLSLPLILLSSTSHTHLRIPRKRLSTAVATGLDMGSGETAALKQAFLGTFIIICHFHFLRAVG